MCLKEANRSWERFWPRSAGGTGDVVRIGHSKGTIRIDIDVDTEETPVRSVPIDRTTQLLMSGMAFALTPISCSGRLSNANTVSI